VPEVGIPAPVLSAWFARPGEYVYTGDRVAELLLGAATFDVPAPCTGRFVEMAAWPRDRLAAGQVLGYIEEESEE
jgi:pyruvate/2-oxoglutarate dehydrogenase complex dihydrolipoamide acyltransferase (E2) component